VDYREEIEILQREIDKLREELNTAPSNYHEDILNDVKNINEAIEELLQEEEESRTWEEELRFQNLEYERSAI
jgi:DNA-binding transcriptional regulator GbsR (MarR family)